MKKEFFKKILSLAGVTLLAGAIGVGTILGVSSCTLSKDQEEISTRVLTQQATKKGKKVTPSVDNPLLSSHKYYAVARNFAQNGEGVFYNNSISLSNSGPFYYDVGTYIQDLYADFNLFTSSGKVEAYRLVFRGELGIDNSYHLLLVNIVSLVNSSVNNLLYNANNNLFNRQYASFTLSNFDYIRDGTSLGSNNYGYYLYKNLNYYFEIYDLNVNDATFTFPQKMNFNSFYQTESTYIPQPNTPVIGSTTSTANSNFSYLYEWFYTGGYVFNQINVVYEPNTYQDRAFEDIEGNYNQYASQHEGTYNLFFKEMHFTNTVSNFDLVVCKRVPKNEFINSNGDLIKSSYYYEPAWSDSAFMTIQFLDSNNTAMSKLVLTGTGDNSISSLGGDIGLGSTFDLLGQAFSSVMSFMSVQVIPGISLGLIMFLPLIAGIIVAVIWVVKR